MSLEAFINEPGCDRLEMNIIRILIGEVLVGEFELRSLN